MSHLPSNYLTMKKTILSIACLFGSLFSNAQDGATIRLDGTNDYIDIGTVITQTNSYTKEAWIYAYASGSNNIISSDSSPFWLSGSQLSVAHGWGSGFILSDPNSFDLNVWTHVAVTYDAASNTLILYKNGIAVATSTSAPAYVAENIQIGAYGTGNCFWGMIDEVRIWDVARTQCEINTYMNCEIPGAMTGLVANYHFNQGTAAANNSGITTLSDDSGNSNIGTLENFSLFGTSSNWITPGAVISGYTTTSVCPVASALNFDGTDDYVELPGINLMNSSFTMETWAKRNSTGGSFNALFGQGSGSTDQGLHIGFRNDNTFTLAFYGDDLNTSTTYTDLNWHHWSVTYDAAINEQKIYLDGTLVASRISGADYNGFGNLFLGKTAWGGDNFNGNMDEVRIWNVARTQCEINTYMNCEIPANAVGLVANYHFNQGSDGFINSTVTTLDDASGNTLTGNLNNFSLMGSGSNWIGQGALANGFITPAVCPVASALNFDGNDDFVLMPDATINDLSSGTIEAWVYLASNNEEVICAKQHNFAGSYAILAVGTDGNPLTPGQVFFSAKNGSSIYSNAILSAGQWYHIAATFNGSGANLYVNGVLDATTSGDFTVPNDLSTNGTSIGAWLGDGGGKYLDGQIDEFRVWNMARTQCEINTYMNSEISNSMSGLIANYHFNQGLASYSNPTETMLMDASGNLNTGTLTNFNLNGTTSNWIAPGGVVNDYTISLAPPTILVNSGEICSGNSFTITASGADTYMYSGGSDIVMPTDDATYTVTGTNTLTTCSNVAVSTVTVNELPTITVNSGTICAGQSFTITPSGADTYTYSGGSDVVMPTGDATYSVSGTDANGCVSLTDAVSTVSVNALPSLMAMTNNTLLCAGETATLSVMGNATTYTWSTTETAMDIAVSPTATAIYTVEGTDANGCVNSTTISQDVSLCTGVATLNGTNVSINVYPNPNNGLFVIDLNTNSQVSITNALGQIVFNETLSFGKQNLNIQNEADGIYFVKVTQQDKQHIIKLIKK
jgi:hypothetical protein